MDIAASFIIFSLKDITDLSPTVKRRIANAAPMAYDIGMSFFPSPFSQLLSRFAMSIKSALQKSENARMESDSMGEIAVPAESYWGAQTQRSIENFKIGGHRMPDALITAL
ncbi:hypothetical protein EBR96_10475, partial [bacterium]|nr:hypothetical protein [bacterium]